MKIKLQDSVMRFSTLIYCLKPSITLMNKLNQFCGLFRFCRFCQVRNSPRGHTVLSLGLTPYFQMVKLMLCWECDHIQVLYFA